MTVSTRSSQSLRLMSLSPTSETLLLKPETPKKTLSFLDEIDSQSNAFLSQTHYDELSCIIEENSRVLSQLTKPDEMVFGVCAVESCAFTVPSDASRSDLEEPSESNPNKLKASFALNKLATLRSLQGRLSEKIKENKDFSWLPALVTAATSIAVSALDINMPPCTEADLNSRNNFEKKIEILRIGAGVMAVVTVSSYWLKRRLNLPDLLFDLNNYCYPVRVTSQIKPYQKTSSEIHLICLLPKSSQALYKAERFFSRMAMYKAEAEESNQNKKQKLQNVAKNHLRGNLTIISTYYLGTVCLVASVATNAYFAKVEYESYSCNNSTLGQTNSSNAQEILEISNILPLVTTLMGCTCVIMNQIVKYITEKPFYHAIDSASS